MLEAGIFWRIYLSFKLPRSNFFLDLWIILQYYLHVDTTSCSVCGGTSFTKLPSRLTVSLSLQQVIVPLAPLTQFSWVKQLYILKGSPEAQEPFSQLKFEKADKRSMDIQGKSKLQKYFAFSTFVFQIICVCFYLTEDTGVQIVVCFLGYHFVWLALGRKWSTNLGVV